MGWGYSESDKVSKQILVKLDQSVKPSNSKLFRAVRLGGAFLRESAQWFKTTCNTSGLSADTKCSHIFKYAKR